VRPSVDLFAVFMQATNELSSFLVKALGLAEEEEEELPPMAKPPPEVLLLLVPLLPPPPPFLLETASAV
jgi:hypothetical protein